MAKRQLLINLILLIGTFFVVVFGIVTMWAQIQASSAALSAANDEARALNSLLDIQQRLVSQREQLEANSERFRLTVPLGRDIPTLLAELESISASSGSSMILDDFSIGSDGPAKGFKVDGINQLGFKIVLTGTYQNFKEFLVKIEKNIPLINVESFSFTPQITEAGTFGLTSFSLDAVTYYLTDSNE